MGSYLPSLIGYQTVTLPFPVAGKAAGVSAVFGSLLGHAPSLIGYATTTLTDPSMAVSGTVVAVSTAFGRLGNGYARSLIGYQSATLIDPGGGGAFGKSPIGYVTTTLAGPHQAVTVLVSAGTVKKVRVLSWDGTRLR